MFTTRSNSQQNTRQQGLPVLALTAATIVAILFSTATTNADTYTVSSTSEIPVRSGQGSEHKVVTQVNNGDTVTSLEENGYWIKIHTSAGLEGWVPKQYLSNTAIDEAFALPTPDKQTKPPAEKHNRTSEQPAFPPRQEALPPQEPLTPPLPMAVPPPLQVAPQPKNQALEIEELKSTVAVLTAENKRLKESEQIRWFMAGGGVLVAGWLIGLITCRSRKRKPSLL